MSWQKRGNARYYTRTRRVSGKLVRQYFGSGPEAEAAAEEDRLRQEARKQAALEWAELVAEQARLEQAIDDLLRQAKSLAEAALLEAGCHQHKRQWRRKRREQSPETPEPNRRTEPDSAG